MGPNTLAGEKKQLIVGTGVWKKSQLLPSDLKLATTPEEQDLVNCLITEVVVPGFAWEDHKFMTKEDLEELFEGDSESIHMYTESLKSR